MQASDAHLGNGDNDPPLESLGENMSIWEAATAGRPIILDGIRVMPNADEALRQQAASVKKSDIDSKAKGAKKKGAFTPYEPKTMEVVSGAQPAHPGELDQHGKILKANLLAELKKRFKSGVPMASPLPHLTPASANQVEHVTSSRVVGQSSEGHVIHERFHQNQGPRVGSVPRHDRFFATDSAGVTYSATPSFKDPDEKALKKLYDETVLAQRSEGARPLLNSSVHHLVAWEVDHRPIDTAPPLSPRSQRRVLPDQGYGLKKSEYEKK